MARPIGEDLIQACSITGFFRFAGRALRRRILPMKTHNRHMGAMEGSTSRWLYTAALSFLVAGCGLQTPDLQSPFSNPADLHQMLDHIVSEVKCELTHGMVRAIARDDKLAENNGTPPKLGWLENWSALATLTLTAEEMSSFNPSISYKSIMSNDIRKFPNGNITTSRSFSLGAGGSVSADGTRTDKVNFFFVFKDFLASNRAHSTLI
jgi:hypothetical protein